MNEPEGRPLPGTRYSLITPLGEGAMGEVFLGEHADLGKRVVIKLLRAQLSQRGDLVARLRQEARLLAQIRHPALVDIYDLSVSSDGRPFFVMEYIEGWNLKDYLAGAGGRLQTPPACELVAMALDGLDAAHQRGIVHRDIKPENLYVTKDGRVKILDFGVAKVVGEGQHPQTAAGLVVGTPRYMSPEQAKGEKLTPQTDLYAIGCVLFELLTGTRPFQGSTPRELLLKHIGEDAPAMGPTVKGYYDPEIEELVASALRKDPKGRPPSASVMALQLRRISARLTGKTTTVVEDKPTIQIDLNVAAMNAARAMDAVASTTTSGVSTPIVPVQVIAHSHSNSQPQPPPQPAHAGGTERTELLPQTQHPDTGGPTLTIATPTSATEELQTARTEYPPDGSVPVKSSRGPLVVAALAVVVVVGGVTTFALMGTKKSSDDSRGAPTPAATTTEEQKEIEPAVATATATTEAQTVAPTPTASPTPNAVGATAKPIATTQKGTTEKPTTKTTAVATTTTPLAGSPIVEAPPPSAKPTAAAAATKPSNGAPPMDDRN